MRLQLTVYQFYLPHQIRDWISIYKLNMNLLALVSKVFFFSFSSNEAFYG